MTEIAIPENDAPAEVVRQMSAAPSPLALWAAEAHQASMVAASLARTSFVPVSMRGKHDDPNIANEITIGNVTAAILTGQELGLPPMAALRSMDIIQGVPALRAHAMRGLVQSKGHDVELIESSSAKVVMRGRRKGKTKWQTVEWDTARAALMGLTGKQEWRKQPQTMLVARATGEVCRLVAADVLYAAPYAAEELDPVTAASLGSTAVSVTTEEILGAVEPTTIVSGGYEFKTHPEDEYDGQDEDEALPHDDHPAGEFDGWCRACVAESAAADREAAS